MKTAKTMMSLLLLSAVYVTPAYANWFSNAHTNTMRNVGSTPNPTVADLRSIGDWRVASGPVHARSIPHYTGGVSFNDNVAPQIFVAKPVAYITEAARNDTHAMTRAGLSRMEGKTLFGAHGARLGSILTVNLISRVAEVQTPGGVAVAIPASLLIDKGNRVTSPKISPSDMMAMAKTQTGHTVAINVDPRHMLTSRG
jgi:hypothetical protein